MNGGQNTGHPKPSCFKGRALLVFDDECAYCRRWASRWQRIAGGSMECIPARDAGTRLPQLAASELAKAIHLVESDGHVSKGAEAVVRALARAGWGRFPLWLYQKVPGMAGGMEFIYRIAARHRHRDVQS